METVFLLYHSYEQDGRDEFKLLGIYSSEAQVKLAIERYSALPGFKYRQDDFYFGEYVIDEDSRWKDGFATMTTISIKDAAGNWIPAAAAILPGGWYEIPDSFYNELLGEFKGGDVVRCEDYDGELRAVEKRISEF